MLHRNYYAARDHRDHGCTGVRQRPKIMPEHRIPGAFEPNTPPTRLTKQFIATAPSELVQEIFKVIRRRLFVAFQPKQPRDSVVHRVHLAPAKYLARKTDVLMAPLKLRNPFSLARESLGQNRLEE